MKFIITLVLMLLPISTPDYKVDVKLEEHVVHYSMTLNPAGEIVMNGASSYATIPAGTELVEDTLTVVFSDGTEMGPKEFAETHPGSHLKEDKGRVSFYAYFHVFEEVTAKFDLKVTDFDLDEITVVGRARYDSNLPDRVDLNQTPYDTVIKLDKKEIVPMVPLEPATPIEKEESVTPQEPTEEPKDEEEVNTPETPEQPVEEPVEPTEKPELVPNDELGYGVGSYLKPKPKQDAQVLGVRKERINYYNDADVLPPTGVGVGHKTIAEAITLVGLVVYIAGARKD